MLSRMLASDAKVGLTFAHYASLARYGGVEHLMKGVLENQDAQPDIKHALLVHDYPVHPQLLDAIKSTSSRLVYTKRSGRFKIPALFRLRDLNLSRQLSGFAPDLLIAWNKAGKLPQALTSISGPLVYYDHSAAWQSSHSHEKRAFFESIDGALCCSNASRRMLESRWQVQAPIAVLRNVSPLQDRLRGSHARRLMTNRRFRLGMAGRATAVKGIPITLHALRILASRGYDCELRIAGDGAERHSYQHMANHLGIGAAVSFQGHVRDMRAFYQDIDCLCAPSVSEPFGLACAEAAAAGCVVIVSRVDGMTEAVNVHGGALCLEPSLPVYAYRDLGGSTQTLPDLVYDPESDQLCTPRLVDPERLACAIAQLIDDTDRYHAISTRALSHAETAPSFQCFLDELMVKLTSFSHTRSFEPPESSRTDE